MEKLNVCPVCKETLTCLRKNHKCVNSFNNFDDFREFFIISNYTIISKEYLQKIYIQNKRGISLIQKETGLDLKSIIFMLKRYGIKIRTCKESANSKSVREQYKKTCLKKYGAENTLSKNTEPFKKRNKTILKRYGVSNVWQVLDLFSDGKNMNNRKISSLNKKIFEYLDQEKIEYETEFCLKFKDDTGKIRTRFYDIKIGNLIIEINGDYFHANPKFYEGEDIIDYKGKRFARDIWIYDSIKLGLCLQKGFDILILWEDEIKSNFEEIKNKIMKRII